MINNSEESLASEWNMDKDGGKRISEIHENVNPELIWKLMMIVMVLVDVGSQWHFF